MRALIAICLLAASLSYAADRNDLSALHPTLQHLYRQLVEGVRLEGKEYEIECRLKAATEKAILLEDGYVDAGDGLKYAFLKFERGYEVPDGLQRGQKIRLAFKVIEARNDATTPGMPYLFVKLIRLNPENYALWSKRYEPGEQLLRWKGIEATEKLADSSNAKIVIVGGKDGLPLILNAPN